jgi:hypothetical protein
MPTCHRSTRAVHPIWALPYLNTSIRPHLSCRTWQNIPSPPHPSTGMTFLFWALGYLTLALALSLALWLLFVLEPRLFLVGCDSLPWLLFLVLPLAGVFVPTPAPQTWTLATWLALWPGQPWPHGILWRIWAEMTGWSGLFIEVSLYRLAPELCCHLWWPQGLLEKGVSCLPRTPVQLELWCYLFLTLKPFCIIKSFHFKA